MGYHYDLNKKLSRRGENMLRMLIKLFDVDKLEQDIRQSGNPIGIKALDAMLRSVKKVQWQRHHDLLRAVAVFVVWKGLFSEIYRPIFYDALAELKSSISDEELARYRRDPADWKINKGAAILKRRIADAEKRARE